MKRYLRHILILIAAVLILAPSCRKDGPRVIPRSKLAKIYAEMFVTDQWIQSKPGLRTIADTSLVYEPILQKYGYDSEDYQHSVDHYMDDPERFSRILRSTAEILDKEIKALRKRQAEIKLQEAVEKEIAKFEINMFQFYDELISEDGLRGWSDSLDVVWDTTFNAYRFRRMPRTDTIYEGPRMIVKDTVVVDSLAVADSLKVMPEQQVPTKQVVDKVKKFPAMNLDTMMKAVTPMDPKKRLGAPTRRREK